MLPEPRAGHLTRLSSGWQVRQVNPWSQSEEQSEESRCPHPGDPTVGFQLFPSQGSQDPRLPAKSTGSPASQGVSQEPKGHDALPF